MISADLKPSEYNSYYSIYIDKAPKNHNLIEGLNDGLNKVSDFFKSIPKEKLEYSYAEGKWTIKEVFQHIIDTERIFMYRCFRIGRHDETPLMGYEQDDYVAPSQANKKSMESLLEEYELVRKNFIVLIKGFNDDDLKFIGEASENSVSARANAFIILGHEIWHMDVIKRLYL